MSSFKVLENDTGLQVTGLRKSYRKRIIIHDISLELRRGEVVALLKTDENRLKKRFKMQCLKLQNEYFLAKIGFDAAENGSPK